MTKKAEKIFSLPLANKLKSLRREQNLSVSMLSEMLGLSHAYIAFLEKGTRKGSNETLKKYAEYFNVSLEELVRLQQEHTITINTSENLTHVAASLPEDIQELVTALLKVDSSSRVDLIRDFVENLKQKLHSLLSPYLLADVKQLFTLIKKHWYKQLKGEDKLKEFNLNGSVQIPGKDLYFQTTYDNICLKITLLYSDRNSISLFEKWVGNHVAEVLTETQIPHINEVQKTVTFLWFNPLISVLQQSNYLEESEYEINKLQCKDQQLLWFLRLKEQQPDDKEVETSCS
jgi:transcriptional regulator with XRE-family HTH domain